MPILKIYIIIYKDVELLFSLFVLKYTNVLFNPRKLFCILNWKNLLYIIGIMYIISFVWKKLSVLNPLLLPSPTRWSILRGY